MSNDLKFTLVLDGKQYTGTLQAAEEATRQFTETATTGAQRTGEAMRGMGGAADAAATSTRNASNSARDLAGQSTAAAAATAKAADSLRRLTQVQKLDNAREILGVRSFHDIQREIDLTTAAYNRLANSGKLSGQELTAASQVMTEKVKLLRAEIDNMGKSSTVSAGQTAMAWRQLPMQLQDVGVSLAGGMSPLLVLAQQGPQITSSFGGVKETLIAVRGAITPLMAGIAAGAVAVGTLGIAAMQGAAEIHALEGALINSGGRVGMTAGQLSDLSAKLGTMSGVTRGDATAALALLAAQAGVTSANIERIASTALRLQAVGGPAVEETAKAFASLSKAPLSAAIQLNEKTGFLTESVYKQIRSLEAQGRATDAAKVAQEAYASAMAARIPEMERNLGTLEKAWIGIKNTAAKAWDAMLGIGREASPEQKLAELQAKIAAQQKVVASAGANEWSIDSLTGGAAQAQEDLQKLNEEAAALKQQIDAATAKAKAKADEAAKVEGQIQNDGAAGDRQRAIAAANIDAQLAVVKVGADRRIRIEQRALEDLDALQAAGLVTAQDHARRSLEINVRELAERKNLLSEQIKLEASKPLKADDFAGAAQKNARLTEMRGELAALQEQITHAPKLTAAKLLGMDIEEARAASRDWATALEGALHQAEQFAVSNARAMAQLITDPLRRARAEAEINAQEIERNAARTAQTLANQVDMLRGRGAQGQADALQAQLSAFTSGSASAAANARQAPDLKALQDYIGGDNVGVQIADGFDKASQSLSAFVKSFQGLIKIEDDYNKARATAIEKNDPAALAAVEAKHNAQRLTGYATMAGAAKSMFAQHTAGYKIMSGAERAFRLAEMAGAAQAAAVKMGFIGAETSAKLSGYADSAVAAVKSAGTEVAALLGIGQAAATSGVASQAAGDPYTALPRMAAMAAVMAGLGFMVGGIGGSSSEPPKTNRGTGTVLGDSESQSKSISSALDALKGVNLQTAQYSAQMAASLRNIESGIGGVGNLVARSGQYNLATTSIKSGFDTNAIGSLLSKIPLVGGFLGGLFGTKTNVLGSGLMGGPQSLGDIAAGGYRANYYTDVETTKKFFGISSGTKQSTNVTAADPEINRQFSLIFKSFEDSLKAAAVPLGQSQASVSAKLSTAVVDIGKVDLRGLTGDAISERLSAVFSAAGDRIAQSAMAGLEDFQAVGEGYLQTVLRVASATESAQGILGRLGVAAVDLRSLAVKQGDIGAELVRQSLVAAEGGLSSSLGSIVNVMSGTAQEIADTYRTLADVRTTLQSVGISGQAVTSELINGAGSLDALKSGAAAYEEKFLTAAEQTALKTRRMTSDFARLGLALPATGAEFRKLVEGVDATTAAGQAQLGGLLALSSAFSEFITATGTATEAAKSAADVASEKASLEERLMQAQGDTAGLRARELAKLDSSNRALQERIWALEDEKKASEALANAGKGVAAYINELRGVGGSSAATTAQRRASYQVDLASAQAGDAEASARVVNSAKALIESVKSSAEDPLSVARETARIAAQLGSLPASMAYASQQAATAAQAAIAAAKAAAPVAVQAPSAVAVSVATPSTAADQAALLQELQALRDEVRAFRVTAEAQGAQTAANTSRTARVLESVSPDGDSISVKAVK